MRTADEIKAEIENVERAIFYEQMADYMNWSTYYRLKDKLKSLKDELANIE